MSKALPQTKKEKLDMEELYQLEAIANQVGTMPDGPEKQAQKAKLQEFSNFVMSKRDLPQEPLQLEAPMVAILDYIPGLIRTAAGEGALALQGKNTMAGFADRAIDAVVPDFVPGAKHLLPPAGRPAPSSGEYRKLMGYGNEESPAMAAPLLPDNKLFNPTRGGTVDFLSSMFLDPQIIKGTKNMLTKGAKGAAQKLSLEEARAKLGEELAKRYNQSGLARAGQTAKDVLMDPAGTLGEAMYKFRFRDADKAARELNLKSQRAGAPMQFKPTSQIMLENGAPGMTSAGTREAVDDLVSAAEGRIDDIEMPDPARQMPTRPQSQVLAPLFADDIERRINTPGLTGAFSGAREDILDEFRLANRQNPSLVKKFEDAQARAGKPVMEGGEPVWNEPPTFSEIPVEPPTRRTGRLEKSVSEETRPGVRVDHGTSLPPEVPPGWIVREQPNGVQWAFHPEGKGQPIKLQGKPQRTVSPQDRTFEAQNSRMSFENETPAPPRASVRQPNEPMAVHPDVPNDILDFADPNYDPTQLRGISRAYQQKSRAAGGYATPTKFDVVTKAGRQATEENAALAALQNDIGGQARRLELEALEEMQPGLGGQVFNEYKDISGLMQGAPFLDRPFNPGRNNAFKRPPFRNNMWNAALEAGQAVSTDAMSILGKAAMSQTTRKALLPAARAGMVEDYNEWRRNNPWEVVRKSARGE